MTRHQLVTHNLFRNRRRTLLTFLSVAASFALLTGFCATYRYLNAPVMPPEFHLVLMVFPRSAMLIPLPLRYNERIRQVPGVVAVTPVSMVDVVYGRQNELHYAMAFDPEAYFRVYSEWHTSDEERAAFIKERTAAIAGRRAAAKYGWKLGDHIHLHSPSFNVTLELVIRALYTSADDSLIGLHWDYLNEVLGRPNKVWSFWVRARSAEDVPAVMQAIDRGFRNDDLETRTQPLGHWVLEFLGMLGNLKLIMVGISAAVVFALLLVVTNTMGMSIRERTAELAILRALGFRSRQILGLLAAESLALSLAGALAGFAVTGLLLVLAEGYHVGGAMAVFVRVDLATACIALAVAILMGLGSTILPAYRASHANIAQALRFVG